MTTTPPFGATMHLPESLPTGLSIPLQSVPRSSVSLPSVSLPSVPRRAEPGPPEARQPMPRQVQLRQVAPRPVRLVPLPTPTSPDASLDGARDASPDASFDGSQDRLPEALPVQGRRLAPVPRPTRGELAPLPQDVTELLPAPDGDTDLVVLGNPVPTVDDHPDPVGPPRRVVFWRGTTRWLRQALRP